MTDETIVTQADRDAAASYMKTVWALSELAEKVRRGEKDENTTLRAFAKHRLAHSLPSQADEIAALRARVAALTKANREAVELIDEINERATSRKFWGISQTIHAKLCTIRITLARAILSKQEPEYSGWVEVVEEDRGR